METARTLANLFRSDREQIASLGRATGSALSVHHELQQRPVATIGWLRQATRLSAPTTGKAIAGLASLGIVRGITGRRRDRAFAYDRYLNLLNKGTEVV